MILYNGVKFKSMLNGAFSNVKCMCTYLILFLLSEIKNPYFVYSFESVIFAIMPFLCFVNCTEEVVYHPILSKNVYKNDNKSKRLHNYLLKLYVVHLVIQYDSLNSCYTFFDAHHSRRCFLIDSFSSGMQTYFR
jgi:hypothetical protein